LTALADRTYHYLRKGKETLVSGVAVPGNPFEKGGGAVMKRTTHRSRTGKKLYAVRDAKGRFLDIQTYERAHRADLKRKSKAEAAKAKTK
jgi:hypothetical protein